MAHKPIKCLKCGLRMEDRDENVEVKEENNRKRRFVGEEEVCGCTGVPNRKPFTSPQQPPNLDTYDRRSK
jgi:hypothetical protein